MYVIKQGYSDSITLYKTKPRSWSLFKYFTARLQSLKPYQPLMNERISDIGMRTARELQNVINFVFIIGMTATSARQVETIL